MPWDGRGRDTSPLHQAYPAKDHPTIKSDSQVQTELKWQPSLSAARIGVAAQDGVLNGVTCVDDRLVVVP